MDGEEYARKRQADAEGQNNNVQFRAEFGAVDDQQNAASGQKRKRRQLAEGGKELADGAFVAGIEKFGDRQVPDRACDQHDQQHKRRRQRTAHIRTFEFFHEMPL